MTLRTSIEKHAPKHMDIPHVRRESTTLGDLIVALTDETSRFVHDEEEVYRMVAYMVTDILFKSRASSRRWH